MLALLFFQRYSLWFSSLETSEHSETWLSWVDKKERDQILKESFIPPTKEEKESKPTYPDKEDSPILALQSSIKAPEPDLFESILFRSNFNFSINDQIIANHMLPTFQLPMHPSVNLLDHLPKDLIVPTPTKKKPDMFLPFPTQSPMALSSKTPNAPLDPSTEPITFSELIQPKLTEERKAPRAPSMIPLPELPKLPTLSELQTSSYSDSFDADLIFLPKSDGEGYVFALTLIPKSDLNLPRFHQHFTFLIDRANNVQQGRLSSTKSALHRCLQNLLPEDTFNIIAFDNKIEKMSPNPLPCTGKSFAMAEEFLEKVHLGSFFASSDLSRPLFLTVPSKVAPDEIHTVILLTDSEGLGKKASKFSLLHDWTQYNSGRVCLFALGMNDPNVATLDAACAMNRGKLCNSNSNRGLRRKLLKLLKNIQNPIAKNLACSAISKSPQSKIKLYPESNQMPYLYLDQPYVILGETDSLDDFILFVQGKLKDRWLNIRKTVSFVNAKKGSKSLRQEYALQKAYSLYEQYFCDAKAEHIAEAQKLLQPYEFDVALE